MIIDLRIRRDDVALIWLAFTLCAIFSWWGILFTVLMQGPVRILEYALGLQEPFVWSVCIGRKSTN